MFSLSAFEYIKLYVLAVYRVYQDIYTYSVQSISRYILLIVYRVYQDIYTYSVQSISIYIYL